MVNLKRRRGYLNTQQQATIYRAKNTNVLSDTILPSSKVYFKRDDYIYITILEEDGLYRHINVLLYCYVIKICGLTSISLLLTQIMMNQLFLLVVRDAYRFPCNTLTTEQVLSYMEGGCNLDLFYCWVSNRRTHLLQPVPYNRCPGMFSDRRQLLIHTQ